MPEHPKIFISYSHDSPEHCENVLNLSNKLRNDGIDCALDQYEFSPPEGWPKWCERHIIESDFVIIINTETYYNRLSGKAPQMSGQGAKWESTLIYQHIFSNDSINHKFIPVVFSSNDVQYIPLILQGTTHYILDNDHAYLNLYKRLLNIPPAQKPPLGKIKPLPEKVAQTDPKIFIANIIDVKTWDKALWSGMVFGAYPDKMPIIGILFDNIKAGKHIFESWQAFLGKEDTADELYISINHENKNISSTNYYVHISSNLDIMNEILKINNIENVDNLITISRIHKMTPKDSRNLDMFKAAFEKHKAFKLLPAGKEMGDIKLYNDLAIIKHKIVFNKYEDLKSNDFDAIIFKKTH